jgi:CelD/BcsL family acetyltransferase involved in cellulose biosynthesis
VQPQLLTASFRGTKIGAAVLTHRNARRHLVLNLRQLHFNSTGAPELDCIMIEHNGFAGGEAQCPALWQSFLRWFAREGMGEIDELIVPGAVRDMKNDLPAGIRLLHRSEGSPAFSGTVSMDGLESVLSRLSANARQQLRRNLRDCAGLGELRCESAPTVERALGWFDALKALHIASWSRRGKSHAFRFPFFETFHRALIAAGVPHGSVQMLRISAGSRPLGYLYNFRRGDRVFAYQSGFDDSLHNLRPGYVCHALAMAASGGEGARTYDFLAGDNRLKRSLGRDRYAMNSICIGKLRPALELESAVRSLARFARRD